MFEEWVVDPPFVISPRVIFEVNVRLLGGLMALGYTIAAIVNRSSHIFWDERVSMKIDWLEQLNRHYAQVQGRDDLIVKCVAGQLSLEGSYVPRTYIEQIQLEKTVNEVMLCSLNSLDYVQDIFPCVVVLYRLSTGDAG